MRKIWYIVLAVLIFISCPVALPALAEGYDTAWTMTIKGADNTTGSFRAGDTLVIDIINNSALTSVTDAVIKFTYNADLLEYTKIGGTSALCGLKSSDTQRDAFYEELNTPGLFRGAFATATKAEIGEGQSMYQVYFTVKTDIPKGVNALNFRWIHTGADKSYVANGSADYNIEFVDGATSVTGDALTENPDKLPDSWESGTNYIFAPFRNPTSENPEIINLNGKKITVTTPYVVVFSKLLPATSPYIEAGILLSEEANENMDKGSTGVHYAKAEKFTSDNHFGVLFYGDGVKANADYYARARVEYADGVLFSDMLSVKTAE
ncbi:MAG: hypothetical protein E7411_00315 [Ruminococcaceae bacterium]|nr:hypothetical protein [Oscillospiraceae bacterium]